ncbi:L-fuculose-phosphate aldolase [Halanaerobium sp. Z-7514]|uniref:L-fuculose-phosphate aldolase n=1 Tax=Halanaerobium polyolivorans TaxID=2886943 RepID=A0AAW4X1Q0_9FIRM|nr:L-fuculose-phosphate aldolase [Halanaerobium polyolivorans]MCC3145688.1 L-fuculose-phosphate aldolase [Halanaerobium polyolivorans]
MKLELERMKIIEFGKKLVDTGLTKGTGGNLSIYNPEKDLMAISPSGIPYYDIRLEDIVIMNLDGEIVEGQRKPSSEYEMHKIFYEKRDDIFSVVHCHSIYSTTISILREDLPASHYMIALAGKNVRCADYATYGSKELAENAFAAMKDRYAVILANHGLLTGADCIENAFNTAEELEYVAETYYRARSIGEPVILPDKEMEKMKKKFKSYGQAR